jgi:hypothetical protein
MTDRLTAGGWRPGSFVVRSFPLFTMVEIPWGAMKAAGWPVRNVYNMVRAGPNGDGQKRSVSGDFSGGRLRPYHNALADWVGVQCSSLPKIGIAVLCWVYTADMHAAAEGYDLAWNGWVAKVVLRDLFLMLAVSDRISRSHAATLMMMRSPRTPCAPHAF